MKKICIQLFFCLLLISCAEKQGPPVKITNFGGITGMDYTASPTGEIDSTDWNTGTEVWSQEELDLFGYLDTTQVCTTNYLGTITAYPNPTSESIQLNIQHVGVRFSYRLVDRHFGIFMSGDSLQWASPSSYLISLGAYYAPKDTLRLYYTFYQPNGCTMLFHGDIVYQ